jgi:protein-S-isoprenylcysteine O-methyltransferase Ste14
MKLGSALRDPWVWGQGLLFLAVGTLPLLRQSLPPDSLGARLLQPAELPWRLLALVPLAPGLLMLVWGAISLGRNLTPATEPLAEGELVEHGAYTLVRHPVYLGVILCLWSLGWWLTSPRIGLVVVVVSYVYFDRKAAVEERRMVARFPGYDAFRRRVPKLIPWQRR